MVGAVEAADVQEVVEATVEYGAARSVWPRTKWGVTRRKVDKKFKLAAANGSPIKVEGEAELKFVQKGKKCSMKFLDADVRRPLASVSAIVDEGNRVVFGPDVSYIENVASGQRIGMERKNGVFVLKLDAEETTRRRNLGRTDSNRMEIDLVESRKEAVKKDMVFMSRSPEHEMEGFRRQA